MVRDGWGQVGPSIRHCKSHSPVYSGTDAGEEALLPFSQSRSRLPGRRLGDMRPDGEGALQGRRGGMGMWSVVGKATQYVVGPGNGQPRIPPPPQTGRRTRVLYALPSPRCALLRSQPQSHCTTTQVQGGTFLGSVHQVPTIPLAHIGVLSAL